MKIYNFPHAGIRAEIENGNLQIKKGTSFNCCDTFTNDCKAWGLYGTAYFSGIPLNHLATYGDEDAAVFLDTPRTDVLSVRSVCSERFDGKVFSESGMTGFFTDAVEIMPFLGYIAWKEKLPPPRRLSLFEEKTETAQEGGHEFMEGLEGDCYGFMARALSSGAAVFNSVARSVFNDRFFGRTLSILPLVCGKNDLIIMQEKLLRRMFKDENPSVLDAALAFPVDVEFNKESSDFFGVGKARVMGDRIPSVSALLGFLSYYSGDKVQYFFSNPECGGVPVFSNKALA